MTRRDWFYLAGQSLLAQDSLPGRELQQRIAQTIRAYEQQGNHRTGTKIDQILGQVACG